VDLVQRQAKQMFEPKRGEPGKRMMVSDNFKFYRMMYIRDIYFVGGFGTMQWIDPAAYAATHPDSIVMFPHHETVDALSAQYGDALVEHFLGPAHESHEGQRDESNTEGLLTKDTATVISIDAAGADVRVRRNWETSVHRLAFPRKVHTPEEAMKAVQTVLSAHGR
jgi:hypothetical protein